MENSTSAWTAIQVKYVYLIEYYSTHQNITRSKNLWQVNSVDWSHQGHLASASDDGLVFVWDLEAGTPLLRLKGGHGPSGGAIASLAWQPPFSSGPSSVRLLASGGGDQSNTAIVIWSDRSAPVPSSPGSAAASLVEFQRQQVSEHMGGSDRSARAVVSGASSEEIATLQGSLDALRVDVKAEMKELKKSLAMIKASVDHVLAVVQATHEGT